MPPRKKPASAGIQFSLPTPGKSHKTLFDRLLSLFNELLLAASGDVGYTLQWLNELDRRYGLFKPEYGLSDFVEDLKNKGLIQIQDPERMTYKPSKQMEFEMRKHAFESLFSKLGKTRSGNHKTRLPGSGDENADGLRPYEFGDLFHQIHAQESIKNAMIHHGLEGFHLEERDLVSQDSYRPSQSATVLLIDISHSMILYGEDRITPAKKVALALAKMIETYYPKDHLDIVVFGDDAWSVELKDLPYLEVGPYHTNTVAGLNLAMDLLRKRKTPNKHIMMITDGKPSCIKRGKEYYKNAFGLDRFIVSRTLALARKCRKQNIDITTFMVTTDPYLVDFVEQFSREANGKALYTNLDGLGKHILMNYETNKRKSARK